MNSKLKKIIKWPLILLLIVIICLAGYLGPYLILTPEPVAQIDNVNTMAEMDAYLSALVEEGLPPAIDVTVLKKGELVFNKAYGVANGITGEAATTDHVYHYWSMTKSFTAVAIFKLVEQNKIALDETITTYLPQFQPLDESGNPVDITVDQLLRHSSGLPDLDFNIVTWIHSANEPYYGDTRMVNDRLQPYRTIEWQPGSRNAYANINYILLSAIIESVTGGTYESYVHQEILVPLKMTRTDSFYRPDMLDKVALGTLAHYSPHTPFINFKGPTEGELKGGVDGITEKRIDDRHWLKLLYTDYSGSTALIGTGLDLSRFAQMLLNKGELDGVRIISEQSANQLLNQGRQLGITEDIQIGGGYTPAAIGYGTNEFVIENITMVGHGGGGAGFALMYLLVPEKDLVIVVLCNSTLNNSFKIATKIATVFDDK